MNSLSLLSAALMTLTACGTTRPIGPAPVHPTRMFVVSSATACPTTHGAIHGRCDNGHRYILGEEVRATPDTDGAWKVVHKRGGVSETRYVKASALAPRPDTSKQTEFANYTDTHFPASARIPPGNWRFADLMSAPKALRERKVILVANLLKLKDSRVHDGEISFNMLVPTHVNRGAARVHFRFANADYAALQKRGRIKYMCGPKYCDAFVIVARLTAEKVEFVDQRGNVVRAPVLIVEELSDRHGSWKADSTSAKGAPTAAASRTSVGMP